MKVIHKFNVSKPICNHLVGKNHTPTHRATAGAVIMTIGVMVAKSGHYVHFMVLEYLLDLCGYLIHGIGAIPIVEKIIENHGQSEGSNDSEGHSS